MARTARKKTEIEVVAHTQPPAEVFPPIPPLPVFAEHIGNLLAEVEGFKCANVDDFSRGAKWRSRAIDLRNQITAAYQPRKQAFDAAKQPAIDAEKADLAKVNLAVGNVDSQCIAWQREKKRKADEEAERQRQAEIARREQEKRERAEEQQRKADLLDAWGDPEGAKLAEQGAKDIEAEVVILPRPTTPGVPTYAKGVRTQPKLVASITNPSAVNRAFCIPSQALVNAKVKTFTDFNKKPTAEQIAELAAEIGGVSLEWQ
jgi:hypothetical protein